MSTLSRKALTSARHSRRPGKLTKSEAAYHRADKAIDHIVELLAVA